MRRVCIVTLAILFSLPAMAQPGQEPGAAASAPATVHDGTWWKEKSGVFKEAFVVGYKEGIEHNAVPNGKRVVWTTARSKPVVEGLNEFYKDFRNTNIYIDDAMTYVQEELQGSLTDDVLKLELQRLRQAAAARKE